MDDMMRKAVEKRALELWRNAGAPSGTGLEFWLQAELELGAIEKVEPDDPFLILGRLAAHANGTAVAGPVAGTPAELNTCRPSERIATVGTGDLPGSSHEAGTLGAYAPRATCGAGTHLNSPRF